MALVDSARERLSDRAWVALRYTGLTLAIFAGLAALLAAAYGAVLYRGFIGGTLLILAAFAGFVTLPLLTFAPLGMTGGEALGNALFKLATLPGTGTNAISQRADDVYEWVSVDEGEVHGSRRWWERFVGGRFGLTYERTREAFGDLAQTPEDVVREHGDPAHLADGGDTITLDAERAGIGQFLALNADADLYVDAAEKLSELQEAAGLDVSVRARAHGLAEHGGDTSDVSAWAMLAGSLLFLLAGASLSIMILG